MKRLVAPLLLLLTLGTLHGPVLLGGGVRLAMDRRMFAPWSRTAPAAADVPDLHTGIYNRLSSDSNFWYAGQVRMVTAALRQGRWPGWDPNTLGGTPLAAQGAASPWYPPYLLLLLGDPIHMTGWLALLHMLLAGLFMGRLVRHLGASPPAALLGALAWALSPWLTLRCNNMSLLAGAAWIPLLLDAGLLLGRGRRPALQVLLLGVATALVLAGGMPQYAFVGLWGAAALTVHGVLRSGGTGWRRLGGLPAGGLLGLALAAPALLPMLRLLAESVRDGQSLKLGLAPGALLGLLSPEFFGGAADPAGWAGPHDFPTARALLTGHPQDNPVENCLYLGAPLMVLALVGMARRYRASREGLPGPLFFLGLALAALLTALLLPRLPGDALYRIPGLGPDDPRRLLLLFHLALTAAGTLTLTTLLARTDPPGRGWWWTGLPLPLLLLLGWVVTGPALALLAALCGPLEADEAHRLLRWERWALLPPALTLLATGAAALTLRRWRHLAVGLLLTAVVGEGLLFGLRSNPAPSADQFKTSSRTVARLARLVAEAGPEGPPRLMHVRCYHALQGNLLAPDGVPVITATHPLPLSRPVDRLRLVEGSVLDPALPRGIAWLRRPASVKHPLLASGRIGLFAATTAGTARALMAQGLELVYPRPGEPEEGVALLRSPWVNPRAKVHHRWHRVASREEALVHLAREPELPVVESPRETGTGRAGAAPARVVWRSATPGRVELDVDMHDGRGLLILADNHYPGWQVEVDGRRAELLPADLAFMGTILGPGRHRVRFTHVDPDRISAFLLLLAGLGGVGFLLFRLRRG